MSRQASTPERTEEIKFLLAGSNLKAHAYIEIERGGVWRITPDLNENRGIEWTEDRRRYDYSNFSLTPIANDIKFQIINKFGKYSEGSGQPEAGSIDNNVRVRVTAGYKLPSSVEKTRNILISNFHLLYHTQISSGTVIADANNVAGFSEKHFNDLFATKYDAHKYDTAKLTPSGYAIYADDGIDGGQRKIKQVRLTANSDKLRAYWAEVESPYSIDDINVETKWNSLGTLANGENVFTVSSTGKRYFLIAVVWDGIPWSDPAALENIDLIADDFMEWIYRSVYYLDSPDFDDPPNPALATIDCVARDAWKKMLEIEVNTQDLTGQRIDQIFKDLCDQVGVKYSATSIDDLGLFPVRALSTGLGDVEKGDSICARLIEIINQDGLTKYEMYLAYDATIDDNILFVKPRPSSYEAVVVFDFHKYRQLGKLRKNYDKLVSRFTIFSEDKQVDKTVNLATQVITTSGLTTISWATPSVYLQYSFTGPGSTPEESTIVDMTPTSITFNFTVVPNVTVKVFGCAWTAGEPTYWGEYINHRNMLLRGGITNKLKNELVTSSAEAKAICKGFSIDYGTPLYDSTGLQFARLNLLLEDNDIAFVWSRSLNIDRLFYVVGIVYKWDRAQKPGDSTVFKIQDTGRRFTDVGNFEWDNVEKWDIGYKWDQSLGVLATDDPTNYDYLKPVRFA